MNILLIGAKSQIGLTFNAINKHEDLRIISCDKNQLNILEIDNLERIYKNIRPQVVINCAAFTNVKLAETKKYETNLINNISLKNLSLISNKYKSLLIHFSTDYVFDGKSSFKYSENNKTNPISFYGITKLEGEKNIIELSNNYIILRISWLFSEFKNNFLIFVLNNLSKNQNIYAVNDLISIPTSSNSIVKFLIDHIKSKEIFNHTNEIYHFVNNGPEISWFEYANIIKKYYSERFNTKSEIISVKSYDFFKNNIRPKYSAMNNKKLLNTFNYNIDNWKSSVNDLINRKYIQ